jgi:Phage integrase family
MPIAAATRNALDAVTATGKIERRGSRLRSRTERSADAAAVNFALQAPGAPIPVHPEWYSDEFGRLLRRAGLRRITLHDSRHTTLTLMEHAGVPISIVSKWAGHYDSAFTQKTYVHASDEDLQRGRAALAKIHKIA